MYRFTELRPESIFHNFVAYGVKKKTTTLYSLLASPHPATYHVQRWPPHGMNYTSHGNLRRGVFNT